MFNKYTFGHTKLINQFLVPAHTLLLQAAPAPFCSRPHDKYSRFILQGGGKGNGVAQSVSQSAPLLNTFAVVRSTAAVRCWAMLVLLIFFITYSMGGFH